MVTDQLCGAPPELSSVGSGLRTTVEAAEKVTEPESALARGDDTRFISGCEAAGDPLTS